MILEIYQELTGLQGPPKSGDFWKPVKKAPALDGWSVIFTGDRIPDKMPDRAYPYILLELGSSQATDNARLKRQTIYISLGVKNKVGDATTKLQAGIKAISLWLKEMVWKSGNGIRPVLVEHSVGQREGQFISARYADITATAIVKDAW